MGWMIDEYCIIQREHVPGVITVKPIALGGSLGRDDATARGAYYCIKELEQLNNWQPQKSVWQCKDLVMPASMCRAYYTPMVIMWWPLVTHKAACTVKKASISQLYSL